jgi:hypothetical protein
VLFSPSSSTTPTPVPRYSKLDKCPRGLRSDWPSKREAQEFLAETPRVEEVGRVKA